MVLIVVQFLLIAGLVYGVVVFSKDVKLMGGELVGSTSNEVVQVASAYASSHNLSSGWDDSFFDELRFIKAHSASGSVLHINIDGYIRIPEKGVCGSTVLLITQIGEIELEEGDGC